MWVIMSEYTEMGGCYSVVQAASAYLFLFQI